MQQRSLNLLFNLSILLVLAFGLSHSNALRAQSCPGGSVTYSADFATPINMVNGCTYTVNVGVSALAPNPGPYIFHLGTGPGNYSFSATINNNGTIGNSSFTGARPIDFGGMLILNNSASGEIVQLGNSLSVPSAVNTWNGITLYNAGLITNLSYGFGISIRDPLVGYGIGTQNNSLITNDNGIISAPLGTVINKQGPGALTINNINNGQISSGGSVVVANIDSGNLTINNFNNSKILSGDYSAIEYSGIGIFTINNSESSTITSGNNNSWTIWNASGTIGSSIINAGTISVGYALTSTINTLWDVTAAIANIAFEGSSSVLTTLTNTGTIAAGIWAYGIANGGMITTLNNAQGATNPAGALTYYGNLPSAYNIILGANPQTYGQLAVSAANYTDGISGKMAFGIYGGTLSATRYLRVLSGVTDNFISTRAGTYSGVAWSLSLENGSVDIWDLLFSDIPLPSGPTTADTQASLVNTANALQSTFTLQNSVLANSFAYDCNVFGANDVCVSAGGRNTAVSAANGLNNTSGLLIAGYRITPQYRVGAYADQNLSVNNAGSTVNLGNNTPLIGLFGAWNQKLDGTGAEVKVTAAYGQKNITVTRSVVGTSEAGSGSSQLNSQGAQAVVKYGFGVADNVIVSPYAGIRYTQNNMGGYTEGTSATVTAPLTYSALNTNATTALAGVGLSYKVIPTVTTFASAGVETDTNTANGTYSATGVTGLTPINLNPNPVKTRPTATIGAYYDIEKNQRLGITGIYRQEAYQAVSTTTVMATYTVGL